MYTAKNYYFDILFTLSWVFLIAKYVLKNLAKLYIPSTLNIDLILWHPQLIVDNH